MFFTAASALLYVDRRRLFDVIPKDVRQTWKKWEVQVLILCSLMFQVVLIVFGHRRRYMGKKTRIRFLVWAAYILADWVATIALGVISQGTLDQEEDHSCNSDYGTGDQTQTAMMCELMSFWAPFLLLHLGGPDTITAHALEDNQLWLRHLVGLVLQTALALYILLVALPGSSWLPLLSLLVFCAGLVKFLERTLALRSANTENLRDSMLTSPDPGPNYAKFMEDFTLKKAAGYYVEANEVRDHPIPIDDGNSSPANDKELIIVAHDRFQRFKRLFVDLILSFQDRDSSRSYFLGLEPTQAFYVVEVELGFAFDMFYTKAPVVYSVTGCILRLLTFSCTFSAFILFLLVCDKGGYGFRNLILTYLLMVVAILQEIYGLIIQLGSDWSVIWLRKHDKIRKYLRLGGSPCSRVAANKRRRWSNSMAQYNLLSFCLDEKPAVWYRVQKLLGIVEFREKHRYKTYVEVSPDLKALIFTKFAELARKLQQAGPASRGDVFGLLATWSNGKEMEFDQSLLMWQIATDLCYYHCSRDPDEQRREMSKQLSDYMLYLLVLHPFLLPIGIGLIRFRDTCAEAKELFKERSFENGKNIATATAMLLRVNTQVPPVKVKGDRSKSVLFDACRLAKKLQQKLDRAKRWDVISDVWVEMLAYAATHCRGNHHARHLPKGGELLTHVWLLMAHLGITQQFQIDQGHARAKLVVK